MDDQADFRGSGWRFPVLPTSGGALAYVDGDDNIVQSIMLLLETAAGERIMRPELGTSVLALLYESDADQNLHELEASVREAILRYEPRVTVERVEAQRVDSADGRVDVDVMVRIRRTNLQRNLVFPFYVQSGVQP